MNAVLYAFPVFLLLIFLELIWSHMAGKKVYRTGDALTSMNIGAISEISRGLVKTVTFGLYALLELQVGVVEFTAADPLAWVLAFFLYDFFYYWAHRAGHEVNILWAAHSTHHSSEEFNMATAMRQSATTVFYVWIFYLPMAALGIPVEVFVPVSFASLFYQFWVHTTLVPKMGWYDRIFVSPSNHRVHHGQNGYAIDVNYGATLILWDRLFGTYAEESDTEPVIYGIRKPVQTWNPVWANLVVLTRIVVDTVRTSGWKNRLKKLFGPPGWEPGSNAVQKTAFSPAAFRRFETPVGRWQRRYALYSYVVVTVMFGHFLTIAYNMPMDQRLAYGGLIILSTMGTGWVLEGKRWGVVLELVRGVAVAAALLAGLWFSPVSAPFQFSAGAGLALMLTLYTLMWREGVAVSAAAQPATVI
ncbi:MAG: sterol desaturase family protein [Gammaproteobacteria bacterium]|nr:sterol desaturase family protein [Woeseia sp.]MBT8103159.1 sterol desaturase family protein [Gammaproteobacteria bacterium]